MADIEKTSVEKTLSPSVGEKTVYHTPGAADGALDFLRGQGEAGTGVVVELDEKKLVRKIDFMIVPCVFP